MLLNVAQVVAAQARLAPDKVGARDSRRAITFAQWSERANRLGTQDARLLFHAGAIRIAAGDDRAGRRLVRQALDLNPHFDWAGAAEAQALLGPAGRVVASN